MELAEHLPVEIVSVDSMQVYRGLDIGTAKPTKQDQQRVPHHLIDLVDPQEPFSVADHQRHGIATLAAIAEREALPVIVGGSGLHFRSLVDPLEFPPSDPDVREELENADQADLVTELLAADPEAVGRVDLANPRRVIRALEIYRLTGDTPSQRAASPNAAEVRDYVPCQPMAAIGLDPGEELADRVTERFDAMLAAGLVDEVAAHADRLGVTAAQGVGYKQLLPVVAGESSLGEGRDAAIRATMGLAKRQRTFFRRDPRIEWLEWRADPAEFMDNAVQAATTAIKEHRWIS